MFVDKDALNSQVLRQLNSFYCLDNSDLSDIDDTTDIALERLKKSFACVSNKYYQIDGIPKFDIYHSCQYGQFLYFLSNSIYKNPNRKSANICDKIYGLNKTLLSCDMYYAVELPDIFFFDHPMGSVVGRASYGDYFSFSQGCTVGNNKGRYPKMGNRVHLLSNSKVLGNCLIGDNVIVSANTYVKDQNIPSNSIVFGQDRDLIIKTVTKEKIMEFSKNIFK